ncbi:MAG: hypothetical protein WKG07_38590 [Hymenobacter sp.]
MAVSEAAAQQVIPPLKKEFLDSAWHVLPSAAGARYRRETKWRDSTAGRHSRLLPQRPAAKPRGI